MAAPVKNYTQPINAVTVSFIALHNGLTTKPMISFNSQLMSSNVMILNQFGTKYAIRIGATVAPPMMSKTMMPVLSPYSGQFSTRGLVMLGNTFPAAYTQTQIRPSVGQLWPRSGALPY